MADWVDSLSDAEVSALYKYKQGGVDSLSDDEVKLMYPHKDKLTAQAKPVTQTGDGEGLLDKAIGVGQAAATTITGAVGAATGWIPTAIQKANDPANVNFEKQYAANMDAMTYEPSREKGSEYAGKVGEFVNDTLLPAATGVQGLPYANTLSPMLGSVGRSIIKAGKAGERPASRLATDLGKESEIPKAPTEPLVDTRPSEQLSQEAYAQALREKELQQQSAFNRPEQLGNMEKQSPIERMASDLGAEPGKIEVPQGPMESFYDRLTKDEGTGKTQVAQDIIDERAKDHNIRSEFLAKQAAEQDAANLAAARNMDSSPSAQHKAHTERIAAEESHRSQLEESHAHALDEQKRLEEAQKVVEERQKALDASMSGVKSQFEGVRQLTAEGGPRTERLAAEAELRKRQAEAPEKSKKQLAIEAKAELAAEKERIVHQRAANEEMIQKLRDQHTESEIRTKQAQADAQEAIAKRDQANTAATTKAASEAAALRKQADALAKDKAKQDKALRQQAKQRALQEVTHPLGSKERIAAVKAVNEKFADKPTDATGGVAKKPVVGTKVSQAFIDSQKGQSGKLLMSWGAKKKSEAFSGIPGLKDTLRDIGNAMIKTPAEAISLAKEFGDVSQNALQKGISLLTKGGTYLKSKVDNPVVHFTVDRFLDADSKAKSEISEKLHGEYLSALRDLSKEEYHDAFTLLNAADLSKKEITPAMMQQYGLSTKLQDFITTHQNMMGEVLGKINAAREAVGKTPVSSREAYSAMSMTGDYRKVAYKTVDGVKTVVGVISSDRKAGKIGWTLAKIEKHMLDKDPTLEFVAPKGYHADGSPKGNIHSDKGTPHEAFQDVLATIGENNPHVQQFLDTLKEVAKDDINNYMGMQTHTMQKKGVWGMEGRKPWMKENQNATQFFENQTKYIEGAFNWSHLAEAAKDVNEVLRNKDVISKQDNAIKMSEAYMQNALGLNPSRIGRAIEEVVNAIGNNTIGPSNLRGVLGGVKSSVNTALLSFNPSFLGIQLIQGPAAMPAMTALLRGRGLAPKNTVLSGGLNYMASAGTALLKDPSKLSAVDRGALAYAKDNHIYATDMVEHSNTTTKGAMYYTNYVTQRPAALIEKATRAQVYLAFVKMMDDSGLKVKDGLYEQAHRLTDQTMNNYGALEKPAIYSALGPIGSMAYNLKSFGHNEISRWSMLAREIGATGNAVPLLTQMASTIALAGVMGLPFYSQWESIYDMITSKMGSPRNLTLDVMEASEKLSKSLGDDYGTFKNVMSHGGASALGMDISKRVGLGDVLPNKAADVGFAGGGKLASMVGSVAGAIANPDEQHFKSAAVNLAPSVIAAPLKEAWYTDDDKAYNMDPTKPTKVVATLNPTDKLLKKIGITGINESTQKEREYQLGQLDKTYQDKRDTAIVGMSFALSHEEDIDTYVQKYLDNQGDANSLVATINSTIESLNVDPNTRAIIRDSASRSLTRILSLQRRMEHQ